jgi:hypothetical protein
LISVSLIPKFEHILLRMVREQQQSFQSLPIWPTHPTSFSVA